jgi:hypothetical protein
VALEKTSNIAGIIPRFSFLKVVINASIILEV